MRRSPASARTATVEIAETTAPRDLESAFAIRREVFCREQGVSEDEEIDGLDDACRHYLVRVDGVAAGTARTRRLATGEAKIERVAVLKPYRRRGVGRALMRRLIADLAPAPIILNAQLHSAPFYRGLGFAAEGGVFDEAGIDHVRMTLAARDPAGREALADRPRRS